MRTNQKLKKKCNFAVSKQYTRTFSSSLNMTSTRTLVCILFLLTAITTSKAEGEMGTLPSDTTIQMGNQKKEKKGFGQMLLQPFKWIGRNWSAYDPRYSTPSFYNWALQLQNTTSAEYMSIDDNIMKVSMRSKLSHRVGPYLGWRWLFYGFTIDLNADNIFKGNKRKNEFTLSINSNLFNIDIIRRRTGGDFMIRKIDTRGYSMYDEDMANHFGVGDSIHYGINGININYFTNHRKYSNPAAFSNGAIQLRSAGSPIIGLGYTHQKLQTSISNMFADYAAEKLDVSINDPGTYFALTLFDPDNAGLYMNGIPTNFTIDNLHLQLGYAYNLVFSRRLLLGLSLVASPAVKWAKFDNKGSYLWKYGPELADMFNSMIDDLDDLDASVEHIKLSDVQIVQKSRDFGFDIYGRASLTYNFNRWRFGINANVNNLFYKHQAMKFNSNYGNAVVYAGYCFGRKKEYRYDGENREAYISAALTKSRIAEMKDTLPASNINQQTLLTDKRTHYNSDIFNFNINGCDLVLGPDGKYGTFEITEGLVANGQDTEGRLRAGTIVDINKNGDFTIHAGHKNSIRAANWWKSQLDVRQNPLNWYPEMLHYALKGRLTFYLRSHTFGTMQPVEMVIDDFCLCHGKETQAFYMVGSKNFQSHSAYSIIGDVPVNGRLCRVYIESKKMGKQINVYVNCYKASSRNWMSYLPDTRSIGRISLPGTHDAGSASLPENTVTSMGHTQNFTVTEQLHDGVRAFDIRLKKNMKYGHTMTCRDGVDESLADIRKFLKDHPSEFIVAMIGSDEGGKWDEEMLGNFKKLTKEYADLFVEDFGPMTPIKDVRGKVLVIKRQEACPLGKLLKFEDNAVFSYDCFEVEDVYKEHKTFRKIKIVENHLRNAFENEDPNKWYITFNSIAWDPRHHKPYYSAWGARNVRKPMNPSLRELIENKEYTNFGMVFLDFYNDHGDKPQLLQSIINSNFFSNTNEDFIPAE